MKALDVEAIGEDAAISGGSRFGTGFASARIGCFWLRGARLVESESR
jgi:hypothetical protein